jgi:hypothetical protein
MTPSAHWIRLPAPLLSASLVAPLNRSTGCGVGEMEDSVCVCDGAEGWRDAMLVRVDVDWKRLCPWERPGGCICLAVVV